MSDMEREKMQCIKDKTVMVKQAGIKGVKVKGREYKEQGWGGVYHDQNEENQNYDTYHISNAKKRTMGGYNGDDYDEYRGLEQEEFEEV